MKTGLVVRYWIQQDYYANVLCQNREEPSLKCKGKCALMKEMQAADTGTPGKPVLPDVSKLEISIFLVHEAMQFSLCQLSAVNVKKEQGNKNCTRGFPLSLFQPPEFS